MWSDWQVTQENVLREIPPLLKAIAFHLDHIEEAAGILRSLAQNDSCAPHQYPDSFSPSPGRNARMRTLRTRPIQRLDGRLRSEMSRDRHAFDGDFTPLNLVDKLLAKGVVRSLKDSRSRLRGFSRTIPRCDPFGKNRTHGFGRVEIVGEWMNDSGWSMVENRLKKAMPAPLLRQIRSVLHPARPHTKDAPLSKRIEEVLSRIPPIR